MFANLKFRDHFAFPALGVPPQLYTTGSVKGTAFPVTCSQATSLGPVGNYADFKKWVAVLNTGSGAVTTLWNAWWGGASASGGTYSALPATSTSTFSGSATYGITTQFGSAAAIVMEIRGEYLQGLNSGITWIAPIMSITTASAYAQMSVYAFDSGSDQASYYDVNSGFVLQETDAF